MKMIKLSEDHYVMMDDSEIKEGDWIYNAEREPSILKCVGKGSLRGWQKITYSTQPLELICCTPVGQIKRYVDCKGCDRGTLGYNEVKPLPLSEAKELLGVVDVEKKVRDYYEKDKTLNSPSSFKAGYNQALEDNKERKYTEEDMRKAMRFGSMRNKLTISELESSFQQLIQSIQPKTEWEVEMVDGKLKLKS